MRVIVDQRDRFARGVVGQAEDDEIGVVERLARAPSASLRRVVVERDQRDVVAPGQPLADLEPGRADARRR